MEGVKYCLLLLLLAPVAQSTIHHECRTITLQSTEENIDGQVLRDINTDEPREVDLVKVWDQISAVKCVEWVNFFYYGSYIVAKNGCQATFEVCYDTQGELTTTTPAPLTTILPDCQKVRLLSRQARPVSKELPFVVGSMTLLKDHNSPKVDCTQDKYSFDGSTVFANGGCRGDFQVCPGVAAFTTEAPRPVRCKRFYILKPTTRDIRAAAGGDVRISSLTLTREISNGVCRRGRNFFFRGSSIVVYPGCKGVFRVCYEEVLTTPAPFTTESPLPVCEKIDVKSNGAGPGRVDVTDANGNPVEIVHVHVWDQISKIKCVEWVNYFYAESYIVAKKGCQATFKVCYRRTIATTAAPLTTPLTPTPGCDMVMLKSRKNKPAFVNYVDVKISSMTLMREFGRTDCREGQTYGYTGVRAFARRGCRGLFQICFDAAALTTLPPVTCKRYQVLEPVNKAVIDPITGLEVPTSSVFLAREISQPGICKEGVNFFSTGSRFIVNGGCKGIFRVCYGSEPTTPAPLTTPTPSERRCRKITVGNTQNGDLTVTDPSGRPIQIYHVHVWDQISAKKCVEWVNYFYTSTQISTRRGCHATFKVCYNILGELTTPAPFTTAPPVTCKRYEVLKPTRQTVRDSTTGRPVPVSGIFLVREISRPGICREDVNFYFRGSRFIVTNGCKGVFKVCYGNEPTTPAPLTTPEPTPVCRKIDVSSSGGRPGRVDVTDANGNPVEIVHVHVWDQISKIKCVEWVNYFYRGSYIQATKGCRATFKVCYRPATQTTPAPLTTTPAPETCRKYNILQHTRKEILDNNGNPAIITRVVLKQEISKWLCQNPTTYRFVENRLVVTGGCKGVFKVCFRDDPNPAPFTTEAPVVNNCKKIDVRSIGGKPARVNIRGPNGEDVEIYHVHVWDQISKTTCVEWVNYFYAETYIVAKKGCQATFKVCYRSRQPTTAAPLTTPATQVVCRNYQILKPTRKIVRDSTGQRATITSVTLEREISRKQCGQRSRYLSQGSLFVVRGGCKGDFSVCYEENSEPITTPAPFTTESPSDRCTVVTVRSTKTSPGRADVRDNLGNPVRILYVKVWDQISRVKCIEGRTFSFRRSYIKVQGGCYATFKVCYKPRPVQPPTTTAAPLTTAPPSTEKCRKVTLKTGGERKIQDDRGNPATITSLNVFREFSDGACDSTTFRVSRVSYVEVDLPCSAVFTVCYEPQGPPTTPAAITTASPETCRKYTFKDASTRVLRGFIRSVTLVRNVENGVCSSGTYSFSGDTFTVNMPCKGVFLICISPSAPPTAAPLTTTPSSGSKECQRFKLDGSSGLVRKRVVSLNGGRPVSILYIKLLRELSNKVCAEWVNFFAAGNNVVAKAGCHGRFEVCYTIL